MVTLDEPTVARFWAKVAVTPSCWMWQASKTNGYGRFAGRRAHRVAYELLVGAIPDGHEIDHVCQTKACVNPAHLEPVPIAGRENSKRHWARQPACRHGHPWTPENTEIRRTADRNPQRVCVACRRARSRAYMRTKRSTTR